MKTVVVAGLSALLLAGCSSGSPSVPQAAPTAATPIPSTVGGTVPVPTNTLSTVKPTDAAVPPELPEQATAPPPATAGPLSARNLPAPEKLGSGWKTYADPGGAGGVPRATTPGPANATPTRPPSKPCLPAAPALR